MDLFSIFVLREFRGRVESISRYFFSLGNLFLEVFGLLVASFGEGDLFDIRDEEDTSGKTNCSDNVWDDSVLPDFVGHEFKDDNSHAKDDKVGDEGKGVSEIIKFVLN